MDECSSKSCASSLQEATPEPNTLAFQTKEDKFQIVVYQPDSDSFTHVPQQWIYLNLKYFPAPPSYPSAPVSESISALFHRLCGTSVGLVDALARFLAQAMDPTAPGLTVLYSRHDCDYLTTVLSDIFKRVTVFSLKTDPKAASPFPSLNQLTKKEAMKQLFLDQMQCKSIIFVRDILPSDHSIKIVRRLLRGEKVNLNSAIAPPQHFYNKLHFICITDNWTRAEALQKRLKTNLIRLSDEIPAPDLTQSKLTSRDLNWIRSSFLAYGLKLRTLDTLGIPDPFPLPEKPLPPDPISELLEFLEQGCIRQKGLYCDTTRLYQGYVEYYRSHHYGALPELTKIKFNKAVRVLMKQHRFKGVTYRKARIRKTSPPLWYYIGVDLSYNQPPPPEPLPIEQSQPLLPYLQHINLYALPIEGRSDMTVRIMQGQQIISSTDPSERTPPQER